MHRFNFPRLAAVLVTATVVFAACAQGPGTAGPRGPSDTAPTFAVTVADQTYTEGEAVSPLTLPEASGGNGTLSYSLTPSVPGLTFTAATRALSGTPTTAGTYNMTYQAVDGDANTAVSDAATLTFTITVQEPESPDTTPAFADTVHDQTYTEGVGIVPLALPEATGGNGTLSYSLTPTVPGLTFASATHTLSGTPTSTGTYDMTYQAADGDANTAVSDAATLTFTITVQEPEPPFSGTVFLNPNVISDTDPTAFETLTYTGTGTRLMFDRRTGNLADTSAYLFDATYRDGLTIEMQVNAEFGSREAAELEAEKYAAYIGKIPTLLRVDVETSWIHRGDYDFGGGNRNILIHTGRGEQYENGDYSPGGPGDYVEEALLHEGVHTSLDETHAATPGWLMAQAADPTFISTYARDYPAREDLAESFVPYVIIQYRADRTPAGMVDTINATIPNRIAYFDAELAGSWCPLVPEDCPATPYVGCSADAETWRGLRVCTERSRDGYARDAYGTGYSSLEDEIIAALPSTMKEDGKVFTPYSCIAFDITPSGTAATDIEHIVALAEAHDSGIDDDRRRDIASDLDNLTIADLTVNRSQKGARDAAEWMPTRHGAWFADRVIRVKLEYGLTVDTAERDALEALLAGGGAQLNCVD